MADGGRAPFARVARALMAGRSMGGQQLLWSMVVSHNGDASVHRPPVTAASDHSLLPLGAPFDEPIAPRWHHRFRRDPACGTRLAFRVSR